MKIKSLFQSLLFVCFVSLITSCNTNRNLVYMSDLKDSSFITEAINNRYYAKIKEGDILSITVNTLSPESNALFNKGEILLPGSSQSSSVISNASGATSLSNVGYLVDKDGNINFPVIGIIEVGGFTLEEARQKLTAEITKQTKNPIVNIRFMNFKVTVVGEVASPGTFNVSNDNVNILEALGMAGDMTTYGRRENVLVIRENNGVRTLGRVNMNTKNITQSPFFYLQQNDVVYVEPENAQKAAQANVRSQQALPIITAVISALAVVLTAVLR